MGPESVMVGYRLSYGQRDVAEKNWIPFSYQELAIHAYDSSALVFGVNLPPYGMFRLSHACRSLQIT